MAGLVGTAVVLERRHSRRNKMRRAMQDHDDQLSRSAASDSDDDAKQVKPPLSPKWFVLSHFSLLVILSAMAITGLAMRGIRRYPPEQTWHVIGGDAARGRLAIFTHGCIGCHTIPGIRNATGNVGPPLTDFAHRMYIGGQLANTPENLVAWLQNPQHFAPGTAMPNQAISEPTARDIAAYLYRRQ
jgi:cytochrome c1